ncbi:MAG: hypothetical protein LBM00_02585 [Deltaproteobacteria bacterium]|jgi:hypothetical protein|nr:hypothetical protein [Deltaproteobacteria bacterium]
MRKDASHLVGLLHACRCAQEKAVRDWYASQPAGFPQGNPNISRQADDPPQGKVYFSMRISVV